MLRKYLIESITQYELAHRTAQRNAALPIEQGGLGLHPNNTAQDRAKAMGFTIPAVHFSRHGVDTHTLDSSMFAISPFDAVGTHFGTKDAAKDRFKNTVGTYDTVRSSNTYPVLIKNKPYLDKNGKEWNEDELSDHLREIGGYNKPVVYNRETVLKLRDKVFDNADHIPYKNDVEHKGSISYIAPPKSIRSVHAAFDPMRQHESDLLA